MHIICVHFIEDSSVNTFAYTDIKYKHTHTHTFTPRRCYYFPFDAFLMFKLIHFFFFLIFLIERSYVHNLRCFKVNIQMFAVQDIKILFLQTVFLYVNRDPRMQWWASPRFHIIIDIKKNAMPTYNFISYLYTVHTSMRS